MWEKFGEATEKHFFSAQLGGHQCMWMGQAGHLQERWLGVFQHPTSSLGRSMSGYWSGKSDFWVWLFSPSPTSLQVFNRSGKHGGLKVHGVDLCGNLVPIANSRSALLPVVVAQGWPGKALWFPHGCWWGWLGRTVYGLHCWGCSSQT